MKLISMASACAALAVFLLAPQQSQAAETTNFYSNVKGWRVVSIHSDSKGFRGCRAAKRENGQRLAIVLRGGSWQLAVPTSRVDVFGGGIVSVDKFDYDAQFGFQNGVAVAELTGAQIKHIKSGSRLGTKMNGGPQRYWSLSGSTAAILKVQECNQRGGYAPNGQVSAPAKKQAVKKNRTKPKLNGLTGTAVATCDGPTTRANTCTVERYRPEAGYIDAFRIIPSSAGQPEYFMKVYDDTRADVWSRWGAGSKWTYMGIWVSNNANDPCIYPRAKQEPKARQNLGQDAWGLCIR